MQFCINCLLGPKEAELQSPPFVTLGTLPKVLYSMIRVILS